MITKEKDSAQVQLLRRPLPPIKTTQSYSPPRGPQNTEFSHEDNEMCRFALTSFATVTQPRIINGSPCQPQSTSTKMPPMDLRPRPPPLFCLNDFLRQLSGQSARDSLMELRKVVLSSCNYKKLVNLFLLELQRGCQGEIANQILSCEGLPPVKRRVPQRQIICELAAIIQLETQARNSGNSQLCASAEQLCSPAERRSAAHTHSPRGSYTAHELLNSVTSKYFQGSRRTRSPFQLRDDCDVISPSELAVLDCLTRGGVSLSFKAHFISDLPDVTPLAQRLLYLNVSFNDLTHIPHKVCDLTQLQVLKLRDNPIEKIPAQINKLHKLKTLVISFCKIKHLPSQLYSLPRLQHLDVSYNLIRSLSNDIRNLRSLKYLNIEGNQLVALPAGLLSVSVCELKLAGNYTHPLLWSDNSRNSPQTLLHTATHTLARTHTEQQCTSLPRAAQLLLCRSGTCDCCKGLMFGPGLKLIQPVHHVFGLQCVPVMFCCCSPACHRSFRNRTHSRSDLLQERQH